jgi:two-component system nitrate/nitrite response regulator NarL
MTTRILLADDHPLYLEAVHERLRRVLPEAELIDATSLEEVLDAARATASPLSLVLLDYNMPGVSSAAGVAQAIAEIPDVPVAIMSGIASPDEVQKVIKAGARGFLPKTMSSTQFAAAINVLLSGGTYLPTDILTALMDAGDAAEAASNSPLDIRAREMKGALDTLKDRELEVLRHVSSGLSNKEIARELGLAEITIKLHVRQVLKKLHLRNRSEAASLATRAGLI